MLWIQRYLYCVHILCLTRMRDRVEYLPKAKSVHREKTERDKPGIRNEAILA